MAIGVGAVGAVIVDAALLAYEDDDAPRLVWSLSLPERGLGLGVSGRF